MTNCFFLENFIDVKEVQPLKKESKYLLDKSKFDKSIDSREEQSSNIYLMDSTLNTSNLDKSIDINEFQPENKQSIFLTFEVIKLDKSIEIKAPHSLNI